MHANERRWLLVTLAPLLVALGCGRGEPAALPEPPRSVVEQGPLRLTVQFDPAAPALADRATLRLTVDSEPGVTIQNPEFGPEFGDFRVVEVHDAMPRVETNRDITTWTVLLEPIRPGRAAIWPVDVAYVDARAHGDGKRHVLSSKPLAVEVATVVKMESPSLAGLRPEASPVALPFSRLGLLAWAGVLLIVAAIVFYAIRCSRLRQKRIVERPLTPAEIAYLELRQLIEESLAQRDVKLFYVALTGIVRRFVERTTSIRAPELTTEEFLREISLRRTFPAEDNRRLKSFLEAADLVKFAAHRPRGEDVDASLSRAKEFIDARRDALAAAQSKEATPC
ncbi:MAG TPA: hypothetical protein VJL29_11655 [Thermoguttaceae bacterium]|nr:hypothetical protein [Thermoguttaceae bacterium]